MNHICDEQVWDRVLSFSFSNFFFKQSKKQFRGRFGDFFVCKVQILFICFSNLSLYSVFSHFCFCKKLVTKKNVVSVIVNSVLELIRKFLAIIILFKTLLLMNEILLVNLIISSKRLHFFLSTFAMIMRFLQTLKKLRFSTVQILVLLRCQLDFLNLS